MKISKLLFLLLAILFTACQDQTDHAKDVEAVSIIEDSRPYVQVLGIAQDAGYPQIGCTKDCCKDLWDDASLRRMVSCIGLVMPEENKYWIFDATPDFKDQIKLCSEQLDETKITMPAGIFLSHAHMGHYTGLTHLGREAYGAKNVPVFAMPRMVNYLSNNGPWDQLSSLENIELVAMNDQEDVNLTSDFMVEPILVPHRDEYSETVGFKIKGRERTILFIPDIDKWQKWDRDILEEIKAVDIALLDGSFYQNGEIPNRDMSEIPHPFIEESMSLFDQLDDTDKGKVFFIHLNHTNPILKKHSKAYSEVKRRGYHVAEEGQKIYL